MEDEKYIFIEDVRHKKMVARSASKKNTHGGRVRFPSDNMTKKEIAKMNGEVKEYRMNEPMGWKEFKALPDDLKISYIKSLREKYNAPDIHIANMLGVCRTSLVKEIARLGLSKGKEGVRMKFAEEEFYNWAGSGETKITATEEEQAAETPFIQDYATGLDEAVENINTPAIPCVGSLSFSCDATNALDMVKQILGHWNVNITISWEVVNEERSC